jgi:selenocysteine lyase/cysteine desulfurase
MWKMEKIRERTQLETYFNKFRKNIIGLDASIQTPFGLKKIIYADWIASGRLYRPIEDILIDVIGPMVGNTHSESSETGKLMTCAYHYAHRIIKDHVNANEDDVIITAGSGMTGVVCKFQRILGLRVPEKMEKYMRIPETDRPVVFISHLEHHSNHTSWLETIADVVVIEPDENLMVDPDHLSEEIKKYVDRKLKIGAFSACSNVTGYIPPFYRLARIMHENGGVCFIDYAASAPYVDIDIHPEDPMESLDAIYFSPHKFLGGPGSSGVLIFNKSLYKNRIPDHPGGGTVNWTNRWNEYSYVTDVEAREDGGTPGFMQAYKIALSILLKEKMGTGKIHLREKELLEIARKGLSEVKGLKILAENIMDRLGVLSFYVEGVHHNLITRLLNDLYGIQVRGGCSCAGTYGHFLLNVDYELSHEITSQIDLGDLSLKPGWVRLSIHPTMTNDELNIVIRALHDIKDHIEEYRRFYTLNPATNEYEHISFRPDYKKQVGEWFSV